MQQRSVRKLTYADFRDKRVCNNIPALPQMKWKHKENTVYIDERARARVCVACMLQLEAHSLLTSCLMNTVLCTAAAAATTTPIRLFKRFNCSLVRVCEHVHGRTPDAG
jgi:hypothetical protein